MGLQCRPKSRFKIESICAEMGKFGGPVGSGSAGYGDLVEIDRIPRILKHFLFSLPKTLMK